MLNRYAALRFLATLLVAVLIGAMPLHHAAAQAPEITAQEFIDVFESGEERGIQVFGAGPIDSTADADLQAILSATGPNQTYDFRPFADRDSLSGEGLIQFLSLADAQAEGIPGSTNPAFADAEYVVAITMLVDVPETGTVFPVEVYEYVSISTGGGYERYGSVLPLEVTIPTIGTVSGTTTTTYEEIDPPDPATKQTWSLPLQAGSTPTMWMDEVRASISTSYESGPLPPSTTTQEEAINGVVDGYGTLRTPAGSFEVIRIRRDETVDPSSGAPFTLREYDFIGVDLGTSLAAMQEREDGVYDITYTTPTEEAPAVADITSGQTGVIFDLDDPNSLGLGLNLQSNTGSGSLTLSRFNTAPLNVSFTGSAEAPDGSTITPNTIWEEWYFAIENDGLSGFTAEVCIDIAGVGGITNANRLVLLTRDFASQPWTPLASSLSGNELCAAVNSFSQFAVGANGADNALPVELTAFDAALDAGAAQLRWETASETNNAGFEVERAVNGTGGWTQIGFVEGAGTTSAPQAYRFTDAHLPFTASHVTYRLRQVDTDGAFAYSSAVEVALNAPDRLTLHPSYPNPASAAATLRYALPTAGPVQLAVYDLLGRRVALLAAGEQPAGRQEITFDTSRLASGVYLIRLQAGGQVQSGRLTVLR